MNLTRAFVVSLLASCVFVQPLAAQYPCSLELAGTVLHLIWPDSRNDGWELYYMRSTDAGKTWGKEVRLTPGIDMFRFGTAVSI
jgi:hypothetical protein